MIKLLLSFVVLFSFDSALGGRAVNMSGEFPVLNFKGKGYFKLVVRAGERYLKIGPNIYNSYCLFKVEKISAPQQTRGRNGSIYSNRVNGCYYKMENKILESFWNSIKLVDVSYRVIKDYQIEGSVNLNSLSKTYRSKAKSIKPRKKASQI